jgi:hypothetical protein
VSCWSNALVRFLLGIELTDPMSGHFMIRRDAFESVAPAISSQGFKILLDILATACGRLRVVELPRIPRTPTRREQARQQDRAGFRRAGDIEAHQRRRLRALSYAQSDYPRHFKTQWDIVG